MAKIGFIGTGLMGLPMAQRLIAAGHSVTAYNRTAAKLEPLTGAKIAVSASEAIAASDCVILMLTNAQAIQETLFSDQTVLRDRTVIQMSTIAPHESQEIRDRVVAAGGSYLEAPVLGSIPEARSGKLIVMVGADTEQFEQWRSLLQTFGENPILLGSVGSAATVKLALNQLIGSSAFAASLGLVLRQNVDVEAFMQILRQSALYAPTFDKKLQRMLDRDFENPNFPTKHLQKDMGLFIETARSSNLDVASVEGVREILNRAIDQNLADLDYAALFAIVCPDH
ncbi:MAG: hydroxyacid dehydrogenase [Leptolyngbya sp. ERB_1_2]